MPDLFARTLSQSLQAFMPIAVALVWLRRRGHPALAIVARRGLFAAITLTPIAGVLFERSTSQARWEAIAAIVATAVTFVAGLAVWRRDLFDAWFRRLHAHRWLLMLAAALIVVRQSMLMAAEFSAAFLQARSLDATEAVLGGAAAGIVISAMWVFLVGRFSVDAINRATNAFAALFFAQVAFYALHRSAEARFLPWGQLLDVATEPYGPDGIFGRYISALLVVLPIVVVSAFALVDRLERRIALKTWTRRAAFVGAGVVLVAGIGVAGTRALGAIMPGPSDGEVAGPAGDLSAILGAPHLLFLSKAADANDDLVSVVALASPAGARAAADLRCRRVSFGAGQGICLQAERGLLFTGYRAVLFNDRLQPRTSITLEGRPSRTRISADGRVGAITTFVRGHGYSGANFSTKTILIDMTGGDVIGDLEQFSTWRDGKRFSAADFNFWGVTFAKDSNVFYATLKTVGDVSLPSGQTARRAQTFLVRGDLGLRRLTVVHENVECPALSPNNRLIAYKKDVGDGHWRFHVLDLATNAERPIAGETRSIDDQIEWLDDTHVLYSEFRSASAPTMDINVAAIDGSQPPRVFVTAGESPIVVR